MKRVLSMLFAAIIAFYGAISCSPEDVFYEFGEDDSTSGGVYSSTQEYLGQATMTLADPKTDEQIEWEYVAEDCKVQFIRYFSQDVAFVTIYNVKLMEEMMARTIEFQAVPEEVFWFGFGAESITPVDEEGVAYSDLKVTDFWVEITDDGFVIYFDFVYNYVDYKFAYTGEKTYDSTFDDEEEEEDTYVPEEEDSMEGDYIGALSVSYNGAEIYSDNALEISMEQDILVSFDDATGYVTATDVLNLSLSDVQFAYGMPALDLLISNIVAEVDSQKYSAESTFASDFDGNVYDSFAISNLVVEMADDLTIEITFDCEYGGATYNIYCIIE